MHPLNTVYIPSIYKYLIKTNRRNCFYYFTKYEEEYVVCMHVYDTLRKWDISKLQSEILLHRKCAMYFTDIVNSDRYVQSVENKTINWCYWLTLQDAKSSVCSLPSSVYIECPFKRVKSLKFKYNWESTWNGVKRMKRKEATKFNCKRKGAYNVYIYVPT
jgi:hypothetical protein